MLGSENIKITFQIGNPQELLSYIFPKEIYWMLVAQSVKPYLGWCHLEYTDQVVFVCFFSVLLIQGCQQRSHRILHLLWEEKDIEIHIPTLYSMYIKNIFTLINFYEEIKVEDGEFY